MEPGPAYKLEIIGVAADDTADAPVASCGTRPWVGIRFDCCAVYTRIYRDPDGTAYAGRCPRCLRQVRLRIGPGGTDARFFLAE